MNDEPSMLWGRLLWFAMRKGVMLGELKHSNSICFGNVHKLNPPPLFNNKELNFPSNKLKAYTNNSLIK